MDSKSVRSKSSAVHYPNPSEGEPTKAQVLVTLVREVLPALLSTEVPFVRTVITLHKEFEASIRANRTEAVLSAMNDRIEMVESALTALRSDTARVNAVQVFAAGFDFAVNDSLAGSKADAYAGVTLRYMTKSDSLSEAAEVLHSLSRLSEEDIRIFRLFIKNGEIRPQFPIWEIMGEFGELNQADLRDETFARMNEKYPNVVRLESFGLLYRPDFAAQSGKQFPDIGPLRPEINRVAILTNLGRRTLQAIL